MKITKDILDQVKQIPRGCISVQSDTNFIATGIKAFYILRMVIAAVVNKKINLGVAWKVYKVIKSFMTNHIFIYLGGKGYVTIDAMPEGIVKGNLLDKLKKGSKIKMYYNNDATPVGLQLAEAWILARVGNPYSYQDFIAFVARLITLASPGTPVVIENNNDLEHCSELSTKFWDIVLNKEVKFFNDKLVPNVKVRDRMHPQAVTNYLPSQEAKVKRWRETFNNTEDK